MPPTPTYHRDILALTDAQLEQFARDWVAKKSIYVETALFSGAGDKGRDVVGFLTANKHDGSWHNYQCKQYGRTVPTAMGIIEIAKVLYYAHAGEFTAPTKFFFVAPRGLARELEKLVFNPSQLKQRMLDNWAIECADNIVKDTTISLTAGLRAFIDAWDFTQVARVAIDDLLADADIKPVLYKWFGADPGPAPAGKLPPAILAAELPYIGQLVDAYAEHSGQAFKTHEDVQKHGEHWPHLSRQRERYFDADAFARFYRDNTSVEDTERLRDEVFHGVVDQCEADHPTQLKRVTEVLSQAARVQVSGLLGRHATPQVKQGFCHHFVNEGDLKWRK